MNQLYTMIKHHLNTTAKDKPVYIFDYDGTLSDGTHRLGKLPTENPHLTESWEEFNALSEFDQPISETIAVMNSLYASGAFIIILTGRADSVCELSTEWLDRHGAKYNVMVMRESSDNRKDTVIKEEFLRHIGLHRIIAAWDDSPKVIEHFRSMGIITYQVCDYGDQLHSGLHSHGVDKLGSCVHLWSHSIEGGPRICASCGMIEDSCNHVWTMAGINSVSNCISCGKSKGVN